LTGTRTVTIGDGNHTISNVTINGSAAWTFDESPSALTVNGTATFNSSGNQTFRPDLTGPGKVEVTKGNVCFYTVPKTYSGGTRITGSALDSASGGWLSFNVDNALGSGTIQLLGGCINNAISTTVTLDNPIEAGGTVRFGWASSSANRSARYNGNVVLLDDLDAIVHSDSNASRTPYFYGSISDGGQNFGISVKSQNTANYGSIVLAGNNSFGGGVEVLPFGMLFANHANALGSGKLTLSNNSRIHTSAATPGITVANAVDINGNISTYGGTGGRTLVLSGPTTLGTSSRIDIHRDGNGSRTLEFAGPISDNGAGHS
jgi:hypothetical protein